MSAMEDAETSERPVLIAGHGAHVEPFNQANARIPALLEDLKQLWPQDSEAIKDLARLSPRLLGEAIALPWTEGSEAVNTAVISQEGKTRMEDLRLAVGRLQNREEKAIRDEMQYQDHLTKLRTATFLACALISCTFTGWCYMRITDSLEEHERTLADKYS